MEKQTIEYKGYWIDIIQDECPESPNDRGDEEIFLVYDHRDFTIERKGFYPLDIFNHLNNKKEDKDFEEYDRPEFNDYFIFKVNAYIHSGVSLSLDNSKYPFNDRWDVSTTGYILVRKEDLNDSSYNDSPAYKDLSLEQRALKMANYLIEEWNQYLSGDVWGYEIFKEVIYLKFPYDKLPSTNLQIDASTREDLLQISLKITDYEEIDSCWGFYGYDNCLQEAKDQIEFYIKNKIN